MKIWNAKDLLDLVFEFRSLAPATEEWTAEALTGNLPRLVRLQRISALLRAFGLTRAQYINNANKFGLENEYANNTEGKAVQNDVALFLEGDFISYHDYSQYSVVKNLIQTASAFEGDVYKYGDVEYFYSFFMRFRLELDNFLRVNSGVAYAGNLGIRSAIKLTDEITKEILKKAEYMDDILTEIINPERLSFTEEVLINEYGFPTDDLDEIDLDNW
ncbi:MAG: hypothetical protein CMC08_00335 [Flavobacteriaceae bacterium]|nr:hypothetical protein [Flavobacteriaceae bacterium]